MNIAWAIDTSAFKDKPWEDLPFVAKRIGCEVIDVNDYPSLFQDTMIIPYGSIGFCSKVSRRFGNVFYPDSYLFKPSTALAEHAGVFLNEDVVFMPWGLLKRKTVPGERLFIKPDSGNKAFTGFVWDTDYDTSSMIEQTYKITNDQMVMLSKEQAITAEYRLFVVGGKVIDGSSYSYDSKETMTFYDGAVEYAKGIIDIFYDDTFTMDVAYLQAGQQYKVVEFNSINSSGLYNINKELFLKAVSEHAIS